VENPDPDLAAQIANTTVDVFTDYNLRLQEARYAKSKENLQAQIKILDAQIQETSDALAALDDTPENQLERENLNRELSQYRQTYASLVQSFEDVRVREAQSTTGIVQLEQAVPPEDPIRPRVLLNTMLAAIVGLMLAVGAVFLVEALDDTLHSPDDVANHLELPVLGMVARHEINGNKPVTVEEPRSLVSEAFRSLRTNIQFASVDSEIRTLLVTSPSPSEGKTIVAANLAVIIAQSGRDVVLLDADLRRPRVHKVMGLPNHSGLSSLFVLTSSFLTLSTASLIIFRI
jgi:non-specific protein-tyrosine kinase